MTKSKQPKPPPNGESPFLDDDIRRLIDQYGVGEFKSAAQRLTKRKSGPKTLDDWPILADLLRQDVLDWLAGGDPFADRSVYSIAKEYADANSGQSHPATMKRITGKLKKKSAREFHVLYHAFLEARKSHPAEVYVRALSELARINPGGPWRYFQKKAEEVMAASSSEIGAPDKRASIFELEELIRENEPVLRTGLLAQFLPK